MKDLLVEEKIQIVLNQNARCSKPKPEWPIGKER